MHGTTTTSNVQKLYVPSLETCASFIGVPPAAGHEQTFCSLTDDLHALAKPYIYVRTQRPWLAYKYRYISAFIQAQIDRHTVN